MVRTSDGSPMRRRWCALAVTLAAVCASAPAQANTTWESGETLYYVAGAHEVNVATVNLQGLHATVQDIVPALRLIAPCEPWNDIAAGAGALCPAFPVSHVFVDLGDGGDFMSAGAMSGVMPTTALGGPGNDHLWSWVANDDLTGGPGADVLEANGGNDLIDARDGEVDTVDCGPGQDIAIVDRADSVTGCERRLSRRPADRPAPVVPATPVSDLPGPSPEIQLTSSARSVSLRAARNSGIPVSADCGTFCEVNVTVTVSDAVARRLKVDPTLASIRNVDTTVHPARLRMRLSGNGLRRAKRLRVTVHVEAVSTTGRRVHQNVSLTLR